MKQNNKKFKNAMHKFVGVLDKYAEKEYVSS